MQKEILYTLVLILTLFTAPFITRAADQEPDKAPQEKPVKKARGLPFRGKISAVDTKAQTVSLAGKKTRTFQITTATRISKDGKTIPLEEVLTGESVGGYAMNNGESLPQVVTLNIRKPANTEKERKP